jgi:hypothetical protein
MSFIFICLECFKVILKVFFLRIFFTNNFIELVKFNDEKNHFFEKFNDLHNYSE